MNTTKKVAIALAVLMVFALVAPAAAEYVAENEKMNIYKQGAGDLMYSYGALSVSCPDPKCADELMYCCIWGYDSAGSNAETAAYNIDLGSLPDNVVEARLYVYWTWSTVDVCDKTTYASTYRDYATYPALEVTFNGGTVPFDYADGTNWIDHYTDAKNIAAVGLQKDQTGYVSYNFPSGTNCSTILPVNLVSDNNVVTVTNVKPYQGPASASYCTGAYINSTNAGRARVCIQGVGLLLTLEDDDKMYWIAEGNDMTYVKWKYGKWTYGITPDNATTKVTFGTIPSEMDTATLTSVVPAGDLGYNRLYFNGPYKWDGLWNSVPDKNLAVSVTDVSCCLREHNNMARFQNGLWDPNCGDSQMNVANAFLVVE